jgi:hypothetical protein
VVQSTAGSCNNQYTQKVCRLDDGSAAASWRQLTCSGVNVDDSGVAQLRCRRRRGCCLLLLAVLLLLLQQLLLLAVLVLLVVVKCGVCCAAGSGLALIIARHLRAEGRQAGQAQGCNCKRSGRRRAGGGN